MHGSAVWAVRDGPSGPRVSRNPSWIDIQANAHSLSAITAVCYSSATSACRRGRKTCIGWTSPSERGSRLAAPSHHPFFVSRYPSFGVLEGFGERVTSGYRRHATRRSQQRRSMEADVMSGSTRVRYVRLTELKQTSTYAERYTCFVVRVCRGLLLAKCSSRKQHSSFTSPIRLFLY